MKQHEYFYQIKQPCNFKDKLLEYIKALSTDKWYDCFDFPVIGLPFDMVSNEAIKKFYENFDMHVPTLVKMNPYEVYHFHRDADRDCCINFLLQHTKSSCLFIDENENFTSQYKLKNKFIELIYPDNHCVLFNTEKCHQVINYNNERLLVSMSFKKPIKYQDVYDFCIKNNL
jgi:hypothetical protein